MGVNQMLVKPLELQFLLRAFFNGSKVKRREETTNESDGEKQERVTDEKRNRQ